LRLDAAKAAVKFEPPALAATAVLQRDVLDDMTTEQLVRLADVLERSLAAARGPADRGMAGLINGAPLIEAGIDEGTTTTCDPQPGLGSQSAADGPAAEEDKPVVEQVETEQVVPAHPGPPVLQVVGAAPRSPVMTRSRSAFYAGIQWRP
jgi:hypothetical protein